MGWFQRVYDVTLCSSSPQQTEQYAVALAQVLRGGEYLSVEGDLGAGKTLFSRALIHALGAQGAVTSPTFVLQKTYHTPGAHHVNSIIHYDFYRIQSYAELVDLGFEDAPENSVTVAEWGDKFVDQFPGKPLRIRIEGCAEEIRKMTFGFPAEELAGKFRQANAGLATMQRT